MSGTNAIELLKKDHNKVRKMLQDLTDTTTRATKSRPRLLERIKRELKAHTAIEEEIFYPALKEAGGDTEMYFEALEEHRAVEKLVLPDLEKTDPGCERFSGRAKVLKELVEHHADEEEKDMFREARKKLTDSQLESLGGKMQRRKQNLLGTN